MSRELLAGKQEDRSVGEAESTEDGKRRLKAVDKWAAITKAAEGDEEERILSERRGLIHGGFTRNESTFLNSQ